MTIVFFRTLFLLPILSLLDLVDGRNVLHKVARIARNQPIRQAASLAITTSTRAQLPPRHLLNLGARSEPRFEPSFSIANAVPRVGAAAPLDQLNASPKSNFDTLHAVCILGLVLASQYHSFSGEAATAECAVDSTKPVLGGDQRVLSSPQESNVSSLGTIATSFFGDSFFGGSETLDKDAKAPDYSRYSEYLTYAEYQKLASAFEDMPEELLQWPREWPDDVRRFSHLLNYHDHLKYKEIRRRQRAEISDSIPDEASSPATKSVGFRVFSGFRRISASKQQSAAVVTEPPLPTFEEWFKENGDRGSDVAHIHALIEVVDARMVDNKELMKSGSAKRRWINLVMAGRKVAANIVWS